MDEHDKLPNDPPNKAKKVKKKNPYGFFKKRRGGVILTREEVQEIKEGRKKLRAELRKRGERSRKEFELTASSLGLYFDSNRAIAILKWFVASNGLKVLASLMALLLLIMWGFAMVADLKGHFTINMSDKMFEKGFSLSEDEDFSIKTSHLFATPAADVPCISIVDIPENVDDIKGEHNGNFFAYTFFLRNEGSTDADYQWELRLASETVLSQATWAMVFIDGEMTLYAQPNKDGTPATLPVRGNDTVGYLKPPLYDSAEDKSQYEVIWSDGAVTYWRVVTKPFVSNTVIAAGEFLGVPPETVHKYTVVLWIEGDDPDCTDELVGGSLGLEMFMAMIDEKGQGE